MSAIATTAFVLTLAMSAATPQAGTYRVARDEAAIEQTEWGLFCGKAPAVARTPVGTQLQVQVSGTHWLATGAGRRFGSAQCEGTQSNLTEFHRGSEAGWSVFECRSPVTRGTEQSIHRYQTSEAGRIEFRTRGQNEFRKEGDLCRYTFQRITVLERVLDEATADTPRDAKTSAASCAQLGAPAKLAFAAPPSEISARKKRVCLTLEARDSDGCVLPLKRARVKYAVTPPTAGKVDKRGCFRPSRRLAAGTEFAVEASVWGLKASTTMRVRGKGEASSPSARRARERKKDSSPQDPRDESEDRDAASLPTRAGGESGATPPSEATAAAVNSPPSSPPGARPEAGGPAVSAVPAGLDDEAADDAPMGWLMIPLVAGLFACAGAYGWQRRRRLATLLDESGQDDDETSL